MLRRLLTPRNLIIAYLTGILLIVLLIFHNNISPPCQFIYNEYDYQRLRAMESQLKLWESALRSAERELRLLSDGHESIVARFLDTATSELPIIYVVTPTYTRLTQKADLTRLVNTLTHVRRLHWILVEDSEFKTALVAGVLNLSGLLYTHLNVLTPEEYSRDDNKPRWYRARGILQRNAGLHWIISNANSGVVYFADDDNTYDVRLFDEMRYTSDVSVWPVGLVGNLRYERPLLTANGRVSGWFTYWKPTREFATDMAGFAVNVNLLKSHPGAEFSTTSRRGEIESDFLSKLVTMADLEPRAHNCTEILVWHTRTEPANVTNEEKLHRQGLSTSDPNIEV